MISTGIVRHIDSLGRVVLPKELRRTFDITTDTPLEIFTDGDALLLRKYRPADACARGGAAVPGTLQRHSPRLCPLRRGSARLGAAARQVRLPPLPRRPCRKITKAAARCRAAVLLMRQGRLIPFFAGCAWIPPPF